MIASSFRLDSLPNLIKFNNVIRRNKCEHPYKEEVQEIERFSNNEYIVSDLFNSIVVYGWTDGVFNKLILCTIY